MDDTGKGADMSKSICTVDGCDRTHYAHGLCELHRSRLLRTGTTDARPKPPAIELFWRKVNKDGPPPDHRPELGPCWIWTAGTTAGGYGQFRAGSQTYAHRFAYEELVAPIPEARHLDHLCRVTRCVNPVHLEPVTPAENKLRGISPNAINARKTHCKHGHPFDSANTHFRHDGHRNCRACARRAAASRKARGA